MATKKVFPDVTEQWRTWQIANEPSRFTHIDTENLKNEGCDFVTMVQMIHPVSREVISKALSLETRNEISMTAKSTFIVFPSNIIFFLKC